LFLARTDQVRPEIRATENDRAVERPRCRPRFGIDAMAHRSTLQKDERGVDILPGYSHRHTTQISCSDLPVRHAANLAVLDRVLADIVRIILTQESKS
jgi:hypothetical protein